MGFWDSITGLFGGGGGGGGMTDLGGLSQAAVQPSSYSLNVGGLDTSGLGGGYTGGAGLGGVSTALDTSGIDKSVPTGGGGFWSSVGGGLSDLGGIAKSALPIAQLGSTGLGIFGGIQNMRQGAEQMDILKRQQKQQEAIAAPASAAGAALTGAGSQALLGGSLPPAQEKMVEQYAQQIKQQYEQYLASIGMTDSSAAAQMQSFIDQQVAAYRTQLAQSLYGAGLQGIGAAMGPSSSVSQTAAGIAGGSQQQVAGANSALSRLLGSGA